MAVEVARETSEKARKTTEKAAKAVLKKAVRLSEFPQKNKLEDLLRLTAEALEFFPPLYIQSLFGPVRGWLPPHREGSELRILDPWHAVRTLGYLTAVTVPSASREAPPWAETVLPPILARTFWRPTRFFEVPDPWGGYESFPRERWFFLNGIATNAAVARMNAELIVRLFHRPVTVIQNATNSLGLDLWESAVGKEFRTEPDLKDAGTFTEPALKATVAVLEALNRKELERVVVLAHSQGTIIAANVLRALIKALHAQQEKRRRSTVERAHTVAVQLTVQAEREPRLMPLRHELAGAVAALLADEPLAKIDKLELYTFANAADRMQHVYVEAGRGRPWIEHFANERDLVARLGVLAPCRRRPDCGLVDIDGPVYERSEAWGHLLNEHYLFAIEDFLADPRHRGNPYPAQRRDDPRRPRLYGYFQGSTPG